MKKIFFSLLVLFGVCGVTMSQTPYKVLKVHKNGEVTHTLNLSDIDSLTVRTVGETPDTPDVPGDDTYEYVDLGLPSGTLWATTNVGAASPADYGDYFAWGETSPKENYNWRTYKWYGGLNDSHTHTFTKYNSSSSSYGTVDNKSILDASDDAATVNWGSAWCMPTTEEQQELFNTDYCIWIWTTKTNSKGETINGYLITSKFNGNSIFLPAAGYRDGTSLDNASSQGYYWSSSLESGDPRGAHYLSFGSDYRNWALSFYRVDGRSVRPVRAKVKHVDLGLPSGTMWATMNVGASSPADYGDYFAWGETSPKENYNWSTYKWCNGSENTLTKYNTSSSYGTVDNKTVLEAADDAATVNLGSEWCMPTSSELEELSNTDNCTWTWTTRTNSKGESINGYLVTSKFNGNSIFLPVTGSYVGTSLGAVGLGQYWTSSLDTDSPRSAFYFLFQTEGCGCFGSIRYLGLAVRPVRAKVKQEEHEYVELGLPSGTLWATMNVGASSPADYGDYFAWGEISPKEDYDWDTYKWCDGSYTTLTKYNKDSSYGTVDNKTVLEVADDAATANWGSSWRMPTIEEQQELLSSHYCTWTWTSRTNSDGAAINGYLVTSKSNGNSIFLPAAGYRNGTLLLNAGSGGSYWSSSPGSYYSHPPYHAFYFGFNSLYHDWYNVDRCMGLSVRPVRASVEK